MNKTPLPLGDRVLIDMVDDKLTSTIITIPEHIAKGTRLPVQGVVLAISKQCSEPSIKVGDRVVVNMYAGQEAKSLGPRRKMFETKEVQAIIE